MRVLLINPPTQADNPQMSLGLGYLAAVMKKNGHDVDIIDASAYFKPWTREDIYKKINDFQPKFIGITLTIGFISMIYDFIRELQKKFDIPIIGGGPHVNCLPEEVLSNGCDIGVIGEGESTILNLIEYFEGKRNLNEVNGIIYKKNGRFQYTNPEKLIENLDELPFPAREFFPIENYTGSKNPDSDPFFWTISSSRGCPFNCIFCSSHKVFGRKYRIRSPQNVFQEILYLKENFGAPFINFIDDDIGIKISRMKELCTLIVENEIDIKLHGRARLNLVTEDMLAHMKKAKFVSIGYGVESGDEETLKKIKKSMTLEQIKKGIDITIKSRINIFSFNNIIGFPWETEKHIENTAKLNKLVPNDVKCGHNFCVPVPYPGTELYKRYHHEYSFSNWWLDPKKFEIRRLSEGYRAFFKKYMPFLKPHYLEVNFFNCSTRIKKKILKTFAYFGRKANKRLYGKRKEIIINLLCRISLFLYNINLKIEMRIFNFFQSRLIKNILKKMLFWKTFSILKE